MRGNPERGVDPNVPLSVPIDHLPFSQLDVDTWVASPQWGTCGVCVTVSNRAGAEDQTAGSRLFKGRAVRESLWDSRCGLGM